MIILGRIFLSLSSIDNTLLHTKSHRLLAACVSQLAQDAADVRGDGPRRPAQPLADLAVGQAVGDQVQDLHLGVGQQYLVVGRDL